MGKIALVNGVRVAAIEPFAPGQEQEFKIAMMDLRRSIVTINSDIFEVENEEKEPGFPDSIEINRVSTACVLMEYKVSDAAGVITFEDTQPMFYRRNITMPIKICAYCVPENEIYIFRAPFVLDAIMARYEAGKRGNKVSILKGVLK